MIPFTNSILTIVCRIQQGSHMHEERVNKGDKLMLWIEYIRKNSTVIQDPESGQPDSTLLSEVMWCSGSMYPCG
jgi:hypothetical protein